MRKIFYYELRRALFCWLFLGMLAVNGIYAWYELTTGIVSGIAYTAPFSVWSYCTYIGRLMPATAITILLLLAGYYGKKQKQAEVLISAAPVTPAQHMMIRSCVLGVCFFVVCAAIMIIAAVFYKIFFQYSLDVAYLLPALLLMVPCFLFTLGLGHLLGKLHQGLVYFLAGILFVAGLVSIDHVSDLFCVGYFTNYPLTLTPDESGEPGFFMQPAWIAFRILYLLLGLALLLYSVRRTKQKLTKDEW